MELKIFNVEHGACALLTTDTGQRLMIDCGHNSTTGWYPGDYLAARGIRSLEGLCISNYDQDHVSGFPNLIDRVHIQNIFRNTSVTPNVIWQLKSEEGIVSTAMTRFVQAITQEFGPPGRAAPLQFPGVGYRLYHNPYPVFDDENNLSLVMVLTFGGCNFLFTGDLESEGWEYLLRTEPAFRAEVARTHVLMAAHHGRENGICNDLFDVYGWRPQLVVISDDYHQYDTQQTVAYYRSKCIGIPDFRGQGRRHVLTTRRDGSIAFATSFNGVLAL
jgi:beta-lactamase superfamily II metal-dependent hydrolase